jgi:hypothetical protein
VRIYNSGHSPQIRTYKGSVAPAGAAVGDLWADTSLAPLEIKKLNSVSPDVWIALQEGGGGAGVTDHGMLTGLNDDDHTQYHTDARGDARYSLTSHNHAADYSPLGHNHTLASLTGVAITTPASGNVLKYDGANWVNGTVAGGSATGAAGYATADFGSSGAGNSDVQINITGQTDITLSSVVIAAVSPAATATHTADEHAVEEIEVTAGNIVAGTGFTIYVRTRNTALRGAWNIAWNWR